MRLAQAVSSPGRAEGPPAHLPLNRCTRMYLPRRKARVRHVGPEPALQAVRNRDVVARSLIGDARQQLSELVHRRWHAVRRCRKPTSRRHALDLGPAHLVHRVQELEADAGRAEPVRQRIRRFRTSRRHFRWVTIRPTTMRGRSSFTARSPTRSSSECLRERHEVAPARWRGG